MNLTNNSLKNTKRESEKGSNKCRKVNINQEIKKAIQALDKKIE